MVLPNFMFVIEPAVAVHTKDGRFAVAASAGTFDVIVVAPGLARRVFAHREVRQGELTELGEIQLQRGDSVHGRVTDERANPVANVAVRIQQSGFAGAYEHVGLLTRLAMGDYVTTTDSAGYYAIDGVSRVDLSGIDPSIAATVEGIGATGLQRVPAGDATIDMTMRPVGTIEVIASWIDTPLVGTLARSVAHPGITLMNTSTSTSTEDGRLTTDDVPEGDFDVTLMVGHDQYTQRATVSRGATTSITFIKP